MTTGVTKNTEAKTQAPVGKCRTCTDTSTSLTLAQFTKSQSLIDEAEMTGFPLCVHACAWWVRGLLSPSFMPQIVLELRPFPTPSLVREDSYTALPLDGTFYKTSLPYLQPTLTPDRTLLYYPECFKILGSNGPPVVVISISRRTCKHTPRPQTPFLNVTLYYQRAFNISLHFNREMLCNTLHLKTLKH